MSQSGNSLRSKVCPHGERKLNGITLIALVITVIVLLILAGVAVSTALNGDSVFEKANEAKLEWNKKTTKEESSIKDALDLIGIVDNPDLAKYKLTVKVYENGIVESPYYVNYPSAQGTIKCRVLYNDSTYGLQIVSVNPVTTVTIGKSDPNTNVTGEMNSLERAENSYNRAVLTLNEAAVAYKDTSEIATDVRCIGSDPLNKNYPDNLIGEEKTAEMFVADDEYTFMQDYNGKFYKTNDTFLADNTRLGRINAKKYSDKTYGAYCIMASRRAMIYPSYGRCNFCLPVVDYTGVTSTWRLWAVKDDGTTEFDNYTGGVRPVFTLASNVKITGGKGTEEEPFELGL